jgi:hypothetical protein
LLSLLSFSAKNDSVAGLVQATELFELALGKADALSPPIAEELGQRSPPRWDSVASSFHT